MAANVQNSILLFGDSITQGGWETESNGFGAKLARSIFSSMMSCKQTDQV